MHNLCQMERYQLRHNRMYWAGVLTFFGLGLLTGGDYAVEGVGPAYLGASSLSDVLNAMVYDSTLPLVLLTALLALLLGQEFSWRVLDREICAGHSRGAVFASKIMTYLAAFNLMALAFPAGGCIREYAVFGIGDAGSFLLNILKTVFYSVLHNSTVFLIGIFFCFCLKSAAKAAAATAGTVFGMCLYLAYGMLLGYPVSFLPAYQLRYAVGSPEWFLPAGVAVAAVWWAALLFLSWRVFRYCDLK